MRNTLSTLATFAEIRYRRFRDRDHLLAWQAGQVERFLRRMLPKSAFYRDYSGGRPVTEWREFPIVDKALMMVNFDRLNTVGLTLHEAFEASLQAEASRDFSPTVRGITVGLSSGTSGNRGVFIASAAERARWAGAAIAKILPYDQTLLTPQRIAFFLRANSTLYESVGGRHYRFAFFDLMTPLADHIRRLNALQPTILVAPPSLLRMLAEAQAARELMIQPRKVVSVAEVLEPVDAAIIAAAFGEPVHQVYQCTEGFLGSTCRYGTLHLHEDIVAIQRERLDARRFIPIITDFNRTSQPIIRYRLNDVLTERETPCPCGSPLLALEQVAGRADDVFILPNGGRLFPDFVRRAVMVGAPQATAYRVVQAAPDQITVALAVDAALREAAERAIVHELRAAIRQAGEDADAVQISFGGEANPPAGMTKLKRVVRSTPS
jgi:putative adenylate-forming enzyme